MRLEEALDKGVKVEEEKLHGDKKRAFTVHILSKKTNTRR